MHKNGLVPKPIEETGWGKLGKQSGYYAGYTKGGKFIQPGSDWLDKIKDYPKRSKEN